ncbi:hypothetical protein [Scleromatobacter humisilvae]|uniref:Uncharacterized protein n=1 Tax=Scleromatobacter humisilvae TaxID=2897159 RepID=A0A9X1YPC2_9BURK|nr:hypothetical protein [Scleromatobacter humisilvae]MCK9688147.1 hypothetical protein [Scleromatobacter humisilvae]
MRFLLALGLMLACPLASLAAANAATDPSTPVRRLQALMGLDATGWTLTQETPTALAWATPDHLIVQLGASDRDLVRDAYFTEQVAAQDHYRSWIAKHHGGLVEMQLHNESATPYDIATIKYKVGDADPHTAGIANIYMIHTSVLLPKNVGLLAIAARESEPVGTREAAVAGALAKEGRGQPQPMGLHDPYDARFDATATYLDSDARRWDSLAPTHVLSRERALMTQLLAKSKLPGISLSVAADLPAANAIAAAH